MEVCYGFSIGMCHILNAELLKVQFFIERDAESEVDQAQCRAVNKGWRPWFRARQLAEG
jgi:hypothetical protein